jgi:pantothenate kinase
MDGPVQSVKQSVIIPTPTNASVTVPTNQTNYIVYLLANIPAGTRVLSIAPASNSATVGWYNASSPNISSQLVLLDANNNYWRLGGLASNNTMSFNSVQVDMLVSSTAMIATGTYDVTSTTSWGMSSNTKPSTFNPDTDMRLAIVANTSTIANLTVSYNLQNLRVLYV